YASAGTRPRLTQPRPEEQLQLCHRSVSGIRLQDPIRTLSCAARLQPERAQQVQPALYTAEFDHRRAGLKLELAGVREPQDQSECVELRELELRHSGKPSLSRRRMELDAGQQVHKP